jgi:hypothetical protein
MKLQEHRKVSRTIPFVKNKENRNDMLNCRPIVSLCSTSKFFKLILKRILKSKTKVYITGTKQHGFKKSNSPTWLNFNVMIACSLDNEEYLLVASLELNATFDAVNIKLI